MLQVRQEGALVQTENEVLLGKLQAVVESHSECLKKSQRVFEDHDAAIHDMLSEAVKKDEIFEDQNYQIKDSQVSLERRTNTKIENLDSKVRTVKAATELHDDSIAKVTPHLTSIYGKMQCFVKVNLAVNKNLMITTAVPIGKHSIQLICFYPKIIVSSLICWQLVCCSFVSGFTS